MEKVNELIEMEHMSKEYMKMEHLKKEQNTTQMEMWNEKEAKVSSGYDLIAIASRLNPRIP